MTLKFSPKFTIATAYPMMFSADDIKYIETDILNIFSGKAYFPQKITDSDYSNLWEMEEPPAMFNSLLDAHPTQETNIVQQLERLWAIKAVEHPQDWKQR